MLVARSGRVARDGQRLDAQLHQLPISTTTLVAADSSQPAECMQLLAGRASLGWLHLAAAFGPELLAQSASTDFCTYTYDDDDTSTAATTDDDSSNSTNTTTTTTSSSPLRRSSSDDDGKLSSTPYP